MRIWVLRQFRISGKGAGIEADRVDDGKLVLCDTLTGKELRRVDIPPSPSLVFAPDGKTLATTDRKGALYLWETATGKQVLSMKGHEKQVHHVAFAPNGRRLVTSSEDSTARVWSIGQP